MTDDPSERDYSLIVLLLEGAEKTFANAEQLFREASILAAAGARTRALFLHQISLEECSKLDSLGAWATSIVLGFDVDQQKLLKDLAWHRAKNENNAYMLEVPNAEADARARGDMRTASEVFAKTQAAFHARSNAAKNAALYVDWTQDGFVAPSERITADMLIDIADRNAVFLGYASTNIGALRRLADSPKGLEDLLSGFAAQAQKLREGPPGGLAVGMDALLSRFLDEGRAALVPEGAVASDPAPS